MLGGWEKGQRIRHKTGQLQRCRCCVKASAGQELGVGMAEGAGLVQGSQPRMGGSGQGGIPQCRRAPTVTLYWAASAEEGKSEGVPRG